MINEQIHMTNEQRHQDSVNRYNANPKYCKACGRLLSYDERKKDFCNLSCANSYNNRAKHGFLTEAEKREHLRLKSAKYYALRKCGEETCSACGQLFNKTHANQIICPECRKQRSITLKSTTDTLGYHRTSDHSTEHRHLFINSGLLSEEEASNYVIHHMNGNTRDNTIDNLLALTPSSHARLHALIRKEWVEHQDMNLEELSELVIDKYQIPFI